tara:strand:- start:664 stop:1143 length:480 start_codon:yes stop_codon:yes gene_type:complete
MKSFNQFESTEEITHIKEQRLLAIQQQLDERFGAAWKLGTSIFGKGAGAAAKTSKVAGAANQTSRLRRLGNFGGGLATNAALLYGPGAVDSILGGVLAQGGFQGATDPRVARSMRDLYLKQQELKAMSFRQQDKNKKTSSDNKKPGRTGITGLRDARST